MTLIQHPKCAKHGVWPCSRCIQAEDEGRRIAGIVNSLVTFKGWDELENGYVAFKLEDGSSDGTLYDSYEDALRFTDESRCAYFCFRQSMGGITPRDAQIWLWFNRQAVAAGIPRKVPDARRKKDVPVLPILPVATHDRLTGRRRLGQ